MPDLKQAAEMALAALVWEVGSEPSLYAPKTREALESLRAALAAIPDSQEPMFYVRLRSEGGYEGPIHASSIDYVRVKSGAWKPLYLAPPASVAAGWQPIETAPKDGNFVLVCSGLNVGVGLFSAWTRDERGLVMGFEEDPDQDSYRDRWEWAASGEIDPEPTHWMPLPAAPGASPAPQPAARSSALPLPCPRRGSDEQIEAVWKAHVLPGQRHRHQGDLTSTQHVWYNNILRYKKG